MCSIMGYIGSRISEEDFKLGFEKTVSRGPDMSKLVKLNDGYIGFHRLAIMGLTDKGMQPFTYKNNMLVCNGEIYGFRPIKEDLIKKGYTFESDSDCEILLPLYELYGTEMFKMLDAEFALIIYDGDTKSFVAARDPIGIRPLYYGFDKDGGILFASEPKNLVGLSDKIMPFPPGHYYKDGSLYNDDELYMPFIINKSYTDDKIKTILSEAEEKKAKLTEKIQEIDIMLGICNTREEIIEVLSNYDIVDKKGKLKA